MNGDTQIFFMPLGGGQTVGASCYFLKLGNHHLLLDAGIGFNKGQAYHPNFFAVNQLPFPCSMSCIDKVFISHAHMDHVGALENLLRETSPNIYMTHLTSILTEYQLYDKLKIKNTQNSKHKNFTIIRNIFNNISTIDFFKPFSFHKENTPPLTVTFIPAGHIPGAAMILLEFNHNKILYTGDFSLYDSALTDGCNIPSYLYNNIDILILCGLHAKNPFKTSKTTTLYSELNKLLTYIHLTKKNLTIPVSQLSKGIELIKALNNIFDGYIYISENLMPLIYKLESNNIKIMGNNCRIANSTNISTISDYQYIYVTTNEYQHYLPNSEIKKFDFSLHDSYKDTLNFILKLNPKHAMLVHCSNPNKHPINNEQENLEFYMSRELIQTDNCRTQIEYAKDVQLYQL